MDGQKIRDMREERGLTRRQVSYQSGVTEGQLLMIETGRTENPRINTLISIARVLDCEISDFLN